jgi:hypothetical protein
MAEVIHRSMIERRLVWAATRDADNPRAVANTAAKSTGSSRHFATSADPDRGRSGASHWRQQPGAPARYRDWTPAGGYAHADRSQHCSRRAARPVPAQDAGVSVR